MRKLLNLLVLLPYSVFAQNIDNSLEKTTQAFEHLEVGASVGTTGIGIELSTPINHRLQLRAGVSYMPTISSVASFSMSSVGGNGQVDENGQSILNEEKTERLAELLGSLINNNEIDNKVDMDRRLGYFNAKLLVDWFPFEHNKKWHYTTGLFVGSKQVAKICNTIEESPTAIAMIMYNNMYDQIQHLEPGEFPTVSVGNHSFELDPAAGQGVIDAFNYYGRVAVQMGQLENGNYFYIDPDKNGMLKAEGLVNLVKPYVGFGYKNSFGADKRWNFDFDAGIMIWGTPKVICDGYEYIDDTSLEYSNRLVRKQVDLVNELKGVGGVVGKYINVIKAFPVLPVIEVKLSYKIF